MKKTNNTYESKMMNRTHCNEQKAARKVSRLDRMMDSSANYMSNYAVVRGSLPAFNSGFFKV